MARPAPYLLLHATTGVTRVHWPSIAPRRPLCGSASRYDATEPAHADEVESLVHLAGVGVLCRKCSRKTPFPAEVRP